jgi:UDP-N-acetylmuramoyl-L-alanyl-D-glutamate--2,6-diaminopimelate ligase
VIVTSDNPRSAQPDAIVDEVLAVAVGVEAPRAAVEREVDRRAGIARAVAEAAPGDVVVIAGKGHEQGQEFAGGRKEPFDDRKVAAEALRAVAAPVADTGPDRVRGARPEAIDRGAGTRS